jgi:hypothetical protein
LFYSIDTIELLLPYRFDTLEYSWVRATIGICTLADYLVAKKCQQQPGPWWTTRAVRTIARWRVIGARSTESYGPLKLISKGRR